MPQLNIIIPQATTNLITNPTCEIDTTGWVANGSTIGRVLTRARFGIASLQIVTDDGVANEGAYFRIDPSSSARLYWASAYVRGDGDVRIRIKDGFNGDEFVSDTIALNDDKWHRLSVRGRTGPTTSDDLRLYVETADNIQGTTFYVDGAQIEQSDFLTTYCDGDQPGCRWNTVKHATTSTRVADERLGGRIVSLTEEDRYTTQMNGMGMPPVINNTQDFAVTPGAFFQNTQTLSRVITLTFWAKDEKANQRNSDSLVRLNDLRQVLIDFVKPDLVANNQAFVLQYEDSGHQLSINCRYDGDMGLNGDIRNVFTNMFLLRLLAVDPFWVEDSQDTQILPVSAGITDVSEILGRIDGQWSNLNFGFNRRLSYLAFGPDGTLYCTGAQTANNNAAAIDPLLTVNRIASWNGTQWSALGSGVGIPATETFNHVAIASNGDVYATGVFTSVGGIAANNIARWDGSVWSALGSGINSDGTVVEVAPNGDVYVGGAFTTAGGNPANRIARWDGGSWHAVGVNTGLNSDVFAIAISEDGSTIYMGGNFTDENGNPGSSLNFVCSYDVATDTFGQLTSSGMDTNVLEMRLDRDATLYAVGQFTTAGGNAANRVARWNGSSWSPLGDGANDDVGTMAIGPDGLIYIVGAFTEAGGLSTTNKVAVWNGSTWANLDVDIPIVGAGTIAAIAVSQDNDIYIGSGGGGGTGFSGTAPASSITIVDNEGTTVVSPIIYMKGPGHLKWIENQSTGARLYMDLVLLDQEEVTINFEEGSIISTFRGEVFSSLLPNSDFGSFSLLPGDNIIAVFMSDDVDAEMQIRNRLLHWSVDAIGEA